MEKDLMKIIGLAQGALGVLGTAPTGVDSVVQTAPGGDLFNVISGAALGFLGMKGTPGQQKVGIPTISGLNGLVGLLGLLGKHNPLSAFQMNNGFTGSLINLAVAVVGFITVFMKKRGS